MGKTKDNLLRKAVLIAMPFLTVVILATYLVLSKGSSANAAVYYENRNFSVDKLKILEIVPDSTCQMEYAYLVQGQEPIAEDMYSDDVTRRKALYDKLDATDMANFGNITCSGAPDYIWTNQNDFLNFVFDAYEVSPGDTTGTHVRVEDTNYELISNLTEFTVGASKTFQCDASGNGNATGDYVKLKSGAIKKLYTDPESGVIDKDLSGHAITYIAGTKLTTKEIQFDCLTPSQLNSYISADPDFLLTGKAEAAYGAAGGKTYGSYDLVVVWKGSYGHLEVQTAKVTGGNPSATYNNSGTGDFSWPTCKALFEYVQIHDRPIQLDSSLNGQAGTNFQKLYVLLRVLPYVSVQPVYEMLDPATGNWKSSIKNVEQPTGFLKDVVVSNNYQRAYGSTISGTYTLNTPKVVYNYVNGETMKFTAPNPWYTASNMDFDLKLTDAGESLIYWFEVVSGLSYSSGVPNDNSGKFSGLKDKYGTHYTYNMNGSAMDDLNYNVWFFKGEDVSLGDNFKYKLFGDNNLFEEVVNELETVGNKDMVNNANTVKYLLNLKKTMSLNHDIYVLEIEPSVEFKYAKLNRDTAKSNYGTYTWTVNNDTLDELLVMMGYLPNEVGRSHIHVDYMTSAALAGFKDDLLNYSFIYIGDLYGDISSTVPAGAETFRKYNLSGTLIQDQGPTDGHGRTTLGSANYGGTTDITRWIKSQIEDYVKAGRVLMLAEKLYDLDETVTVEKETVMYQLIESVRDLDTRGLVVKDTNTTASMRRIFDRSNAMPLLTLNGGPTEWDGANFNAAGSRFSFDYDVMCNPGTQFVAEYYIDMNGDGRFIDADETSEDETELIDTIVIGTTNSEGKLNTGATYYLPGEGADKKSGFLPWRIIVYPRDHRENRASLTGYTAVKPEAKKIINVLQIEPCPSKAQSMSTMGANAANSTFTLDNTPGDGYEPGDRAYEKKFVEMLTKVADYDIRIYTVDGNTFKNWYNPSKTVRLYEKDANDEGLVLGDPTRGAKYDRNNPDTEILMDTFDMIVLGFGDEYKNDLADNNDGIFNVYDFAKEGRAVLMAHDFIYAFIAPMDTADKPGGYNPKAGLLFRDISGMDRFGLMHRYVKNYVGVSAFPTTYGKYVPEQADSDAYSDLLKGTDSISHLIKSTDITPYSAYNMGWLVRFKPNSSTIDKIPYGTSYPYSTVPMKCNGSNLVTRKTIRLNKGAVTEYPYVLKDTIEVADTHCQYVSLNLEDEDVFVWYNLAGKNTSPSAQLYNATYNSAWDNYYVYSAENIVYTGAGHTYHTANPTNDEMELFINTMVAAIRSGNNAPVVTVSNATKSKESDCDYIFYISETDEIASLDFRVSDVDLITGLSIRDVKIYWDCSTGTGDGHNGKYDEGKDKVLMKYVNVIKNSMDKTTYYGSEKNYNSALLPSDTANGTDIANGIEYYRVGSSIMTNTLESTGIAQLNTHILDKTGAEQCLYIVIEAKDAKGATGRARVKVKFMDLYLLD